jgi:hypothetical protein
MSDTRPTQSDAIDKLAGALAKAQAEILVATKDGENPHFKSRFTTLAEVFDAVREPLSKNNLSIVQAPQQGDGNAHYLETTLMHSSGQWMKSYHPLHPVKNDPQSVGSAITYARRYALCAMVGVVGREEDDDGEAAHGRGPATPPSRQAAPAKPAAPPAAKPTSAPVSKPAAAKTPLGFEKLKAEMEAATTMEELQAVGAKVVNEPKAVQEQMRPIYLGERKRIGAGPKTSAPAEPAGDEVAV